MEMICVNGRFSADQLAFYKKYGVTIPKEDEFYTPRRISKNSNGDWEVLLNEIVNPHVPVKHPVMGIIDMEVSWKLSRFANLDQSQITKEQVKEFKDQEKLIEK